jgi:hypothetical protein
MRTLGRAYLNQLRRRQFRITWDVRLVKASGAEYSIPPAAIVSRERSADIDSGTWKLSMTVYPSRLPRRVVVEQYDALEIDLLIKGEAAPIPYFRGVIDKAPYQQDLDTGAIVDLQDIEAFGNLQRVKGYPIPHLTHRPAILGANPSALFELTALCSKKRVQPMTSISAGGSESVPSGGATHGLTTGAFVIYTGPDMTTGYAKGSEFTIDASVFPAKINWLIAPATNRVIEWVQLDRWVYSRVRDYFGSDAPRSVILPVGRRFDDLYHTWILAVDRNAGTVTLADSTGYRDKFSGLLEWVTFTLADGTEVMQQVGPVQTGLQNGILKFATPLPVDLQPGDSIRLSTTEYTQAWEDLNWFNYFHTGSGTGTARYNPRYILAVPNMGMAVPLEPRNWLTTERIFADIALIRQDVDSNRVEEVIKDFLTTKTGLFSPESIKTERTGAYIKNYRATGLDASEVLAQHKDHALPPETRLHDEPDGTITIRPYVQKPEPDWILTGIDGLEEVEAPEPVTAVTVIAEGEEVNVAAEMFSTSTGTADPLRVTDGQKKDAATPTTAGGSIAFWFKLPLPTPESAHPTISKIRITGKGVLTLYAGADLTWATLPGYQSRVLGTTQEGTVEIEGENLAQVIANDLGKPLSIGIYIDPLRGGITGSTVEVEAACHEVEILTTQAGAWRAELTDDQSLAIADQGPEAFGTIWRQADPEKRVSYRYAPTAYLQQVSPLYRAPGGPLPTVARHLPLRMKGISPQATRDRGERWLDELQRGGKTYTARATLDLRAELGDTVRAVRKDGTHLDLLLTGLSDSGDAESLEAEYTLSDYSR